MAILENDTASRSDGESVPGYETKFVRYEQSSRCESVKDSSVSYVSGLIVERG